MDPRVVYNGWHNCHRLGQKDTRAHAGGPAAIKEDFATHLSQAETTGAEGKSAAGNAKMPAAPLPYAFACQAGEPMCARAHPPLAEQIRVYKEDQLLAHPGGKYVDLSRENPWIAPEEQQGFLESIAKDFKDALANVGNFFKDLIAGSRYRYVDGAGNLQTAQRKGLLHCVAALVKDLASGLSFGLYRPDGDPEPQGARERAHYAYKKLIEGAVCKDVVYGIPANLVTLVDDQALALWNLLEVVPDATLGSFSQGKKVVTSLFDNGQVAIDYITDCVPTGEAWMRVHAVRFERGEVQPPVLYNLKLPTHYSDDSRWSTVRNTPLRKSLETVGSLLADIGTALGVHYSLQSSRRRD